MVCMVSGSFARATRLRLWDERLRKLVGFRHLKNLRRRVKGPQKKDFID